MLVTNIKKMIQKNAKILVLTIRLENLEKSTDAKSAHTITGGGDNGNNIQGAGSKSNNPTGSMTGQITTRRTIKKYQRPPHLIVQQSIRVLSMYIPKDYSMVPTVGINQRIKIVGRPP